jgi:mRNA-degrading endonuclease RelE of RelBE toxin-antitoxin system
LKYKIYWSQGAVDDLAQVFATRPRDGQKIVLAVRLLGRDGRGDVKRLRGGTADSRLRVGDWRVILVFEDGDVWINQIDNRRDAY